jgi:long-chain acyl-CoA synthetase
LTRDLTPAATVPDLLIQAVREFPDRRAIECGGRVLTFAELDERRLSCAAALRDRGLRHAERVLLVAENSIEYVEACFAALTLGAIVAPLAPDTPVDRVRATAASLEAQMILASRTAAAALDRAANETPVVRLVTDLTSGMSASRSGLGDAVSSGDLAMVLQTSGTTSDPKGVMLTHANLVANTIAIVESLTLTSRDSVLTVLPFSYSFGNSILLTHIAAGAAIVVENRFAFPEIVVQALHDARPTGFYGVPTTFYLLLSRTTFPDRDWSFLRYIAQAGGGLRTDALRRLRALLPNTDIYIMYGQTEASARLTVLPPSILDAKLGSIGRAIAATELRVVDADDKPLPPGQVGELVVRGPGVMAGYVGDPDGTARALRGGWLHTGDLAVADEDDFLWIVGRNADFIKCAGVRIAPAEVESVVAAIDGVEDVAAFAVDDELLGEAVAVSVVPKQCPVSATEIL